MIPVLVVAVKSLSSVVCIDGTGKLFGDFHLSQCALVILLNRFLLHQLFGLVGFDQ